MKNAMERENEETDLFSVWVDWQNRIVSFQQAEGFEKLEYPTHQEMFQFAIEKSMSGYAIQ